MSQKYVGLPDIDASQDVYETLSPPDSPILKDEDDLDEAHIRALRLQREQEKEAEREARRAGGRLGGGDAGRKVPLEELEEIDWHAGVSVDEGKRKWRKLERKGVKKADIAATFVLDETPLQRFARLQQELAELEDHVAQQKVSQGKARLENGTGIGDPEGEAGMMHSLLELRERLGKLEGGGQLQEVEEGDEEQVEEEDIKAPKANGNGNAHPEEDDRRASTSSESHAGIVALDRRLAQIEALLGSNSISSADPHPAPLVSTLTKLSTQIGLLTQPRHLDGLSRRLKTLLSDLERYDQHVHSQPAASNANANANAGWSTAAAGAAGRSRQPTGPDDRPQQSTQQLMHLLSRLDPLLPTIPPLLLRLRSLSALHASAATFAGRLREAEEREKAMEAGLEELEAAVEGLERGEVENRVQVEGNVRVLEERVAGVMGRLELLERGLGQ
ncbi:hypothetical protein CALCODRAFT_497768 [Calocera cornea HHB12733]|uniref:Dynamitin-domain-containing protein n=1 Tax=Calocera cornea HHB12733 TaxID=1353952 RepID=A0A165F4V0_9BASI|nr:hypothetical protein CALCODRAFT_497768 [Calocera cornea HHB12733]